MSKGLLISLIVNFIIIVPVVYLSFTWRKHLRKAIDGILFQHHEQKLSMFEAMPVRDSSIIILGNSIIEGANWSELFGNDRIINRGISADVTQGVIDRMDEIIRHQAAKLFIAIGTNDISRSIPIETILANYKVILKRMMEDSPNTKVYIQSVLPVAVEPGSMYSHNNEGILTLNKALVKLCKENSITYINLSPHFANEQGKLKAEFTNDDLHLLGSAYLHWKDLIQSYIDE